LTTNFTVRFIFNDCGNQRLRYTPTP